MESAFMKAKKKAKSKKEKIEDFKTMIDDPVVKTILDDMPVDQLIDILGDGVNETAISDPVIFKQEEPKKAQPMATKHKTKPSTENQAFDLIYNPATKKYHLVVIQYDLDKGIGSVVSTNELGGNQAIVLTEMQAIFVRKVMEYSRRKTKK